MRKAISIIGVPMDLGQTRRGVDMGPSAIRYANVAERLEALQYDVHDVGNIPVEKTNHAEDFQVDSLSNLNDIKIANTQLANTIITEIKKGHFPLVLGGDHSIAIGTLAGVSQQTESLGLIWFDAHGDMNTPETSPSGNIHGMSLSASLGYGHRDLTEMLGQVTKVRPENVVLIGVRELDPGEKQLLRELGIKVFTMHEIDRLGMAKVMDDTMAYLQKRTNNIHVSFDLDVLNPSEAPGVGTPVIGGITYREAHLALELLANSGCVSSAEFVEVNPILDDKNKTAELTVALIGSLFGETLI